MAGSRLGNVVTPWSSLRDGREYVVSVSIVENPRGLSILLTDKITAEEWSCQYDFKHIEDLTRKTGSYKPFETFVLMIKNAILKNTDSVRVELYSIEELKQLKIQRHNTGIIATNEFVGSNLKHNSAGNQSAQHEGYQKELPSHSQDSEKKKFLIVSYEAEFDSVNYPLPLVYSGLPDPLKMQNNIKKLRHEVSQLRNVNLQLRDQIQSKGTRLIIQDGNLEHDLRDDLLFSATQLQHLQTRNKLHDLKPKTSFPDAETNNNNENHGRGRTTNDSDNQGKVSTLLSMVKQLEVRIETQSTVFIERIHKLEIENDGLLKQVEKQKRDEEMHLLKINQLENAVHELATLAKKRNRDRFPSSGSRSSRNGSIASSVSPEITPRLTTIHAPTNAKTRPRPPARKQEVCPRFFRAKDRQESVSPGGRRSSGSGSASRSEYKRGSSGPPFNPTAYVQEQKSRQEEIKMQRLAEIQRNIDESRKRIESGIRRQTQERGSPYLRSWNRNTPKTSSVSGSDRENSNPRSIGIERPSRSRIRREYVPQHKPRPRLAEMQQQQRNVFNYELGRHTKSRLEERRLRSLSTGSGRSASASVKRYSCSGGTPTPSPVRKQLNNIHTRAREQKRSSGKSTPDAVVEPIPFSKKSPSPSRLPPRKSASILMPKNASIDLTKQVDGSNANAMLPHRSRTRSFVSTEPGSDHLITGSIEAIEILIERIKSGGNVHYEPEVKSGKRKEGEYPKYRYAEIEAMIAELKGASGHSRSEGTNTNNPAVFNGVYGHRRVNNAFDLIPPPIPARRQESGEVD